MNIITGYRGEPHITSAQDRAGNQGSYGTGSYVLNVGNKLAATIASANEIRIADGALCHQGCLANIDAGTYDSVAINNGTQGMNRIDRIVARYTKNAETNVESLDLVVIEGTAVSGTPSAPAYNTGNIQNGDSPVDMPLYQVRLTGVTVASVTKEFDYVRTQKELDAAVSSLNSKFASGGLFRIEIISSEYSKPVGGAGGITFTIPTKNGYTPIGIVGCYTGSNHVVIYELRLISNIAARLMVQGDSSAATQSTAIIYVLYIRNS